MHPIEIQQLDKFFKIRRQRVQILRQVSFQVQQGQSVGFIGQNGAGKSTTFKILLGALQADGGQALLMGHPARDPRSRRGVGYVPENPYLYDLLTPRELVSSGLRLHGIRGPDNTRRTRDWLEKLDIAHAANKRIRDLSKGMTQRTALAHAFALEPELLILDEPMSGLDPVGRQEVADLMQSYRQGGGTLLFSSHILHDVERLADRFVLIHQGQVQAQQDMAELLAQQTHLQVRYHGSQALSGFSEESPGIWSRQCPRTDIATCLGQVNTIGTLLDIKPRNVLEEIFREIQEKQPCNSKP